MNAARRLKRLSFSMPDVTGAGYSNAPAYYRPTQGIVEEREDEEEEEEEETDGENGRSDSGAREEREEGHVWMDATDPVSGSVFYVDSTPLPRPHPNGSAIRPSTSSSSLSSSTASLSHPGLTSSPLPHPPSLGPSSFFISLPPTPNDSFFSSLAFPPPRSVTPQYSRSRTSYSTSDRGFSSTLPSPANSEDIEGFFPSDGVLPEPLPEHPSPCPSPSPSEGWLPKSNSMSLVGTSVRRGWKKFVGRGSRRGRKISTRSQRMVPSDSVPNLLCEESYGYSARDHHGDGDNLSLTDSPYATLYGSRGFPLAGSQASIISVRISLKPHPQAGRPHRNWNLEKLGIIPARALGGKRYRSFSNLRHAFKSHTSLGSSPSSPSSPSPPRSSGNSLIVRGILPGTPASLASQLQPGDTILAVNGHAVSLDNANSVIRQQSRSEEAELVLIVKKNTLYSSTLLTSTPAHHHLHTSSRHSELVRLVSGRHHSHHSPHSHHLLLYLTLSTSEEDPPDKDILYCHMNDGQDGEREGVGAHLKQLRGVFLTLGDVMESITSDNTSSSSVVVEGQLFHLAHVQRGKEVLLLVLPASLLPPHLVLATLKRIDSTLSLLHGSTERALSRVEHHSRVDHVLSLLFHQLTSHKSPLPLIVSPLTSLPAVPRWLLSVQATLHVSEALDVLENVSPAHQLTELTHSQRQLIPRGSCLFYQGQLVQSHLPSEEMVEVAMFCQAYRLLEISADEPHSSIVIWRELHLQRGSEEDGDRLRVCERVFLLLVGLDHYLVGLVLEGCGLPPETTPTLDPTYVSEAKQLIAKLDIQDIFSSTAPREVSSRSQAPAVASLDRQLTLHISSSLTSSGLSPFPHRRKSLGTSSTQGSDSDEDDDTRAKFGPRSMTLPSFKPRGKRKLEPIREIPATLSLRPNYTLTAGVDNLLLHYLSLEAGQGVWLCPAHHMRSPYGTLHSEMLTCFHGTCAGIRSILLARTNDEGSEESDSECDWESDEDDEETVYKEPPPPSFSAPLPGGRCVEHGVLLEVPLKHFVTDKQLKTTPPLCYWVVGRLFPESDRELYVCHEENASQNVVEMAFKLLFATHT